MQDNTNVKMKRVGYCLSDKKSKKLNLDEFDNMCRNENIELVKIDLDRPLADQGPFHLIFHKLTEQIVRANQGKAQEARMIQHLQTYLSEHPGTVVIDPLTNISQLLDRHDQYRHVEGCSVVEEDCCYFCPSFVEFKSTDIDTNKQLMEQYRVQYPFVCKSSFAHGSSQSHKMMIIFSEEGLRDVQPPCVAQTFINHNAMLVKVFIIGDRHYVVRRPSIKNLEAGDFRTIYFDSHDVSKVDSTSSLNQCDDLQQPIIMPKPKKIKKLVDGLREKLGLSLFGIDIIIENLTGRYAVIDINPFPSYVGVPNFFKDLLHLIQTGLGTEEITEDVQESDDTFQTTEIDQKLYESLSILEREKEEQSKLCYFDLHPDGPEHVNDRSEDEIRQKNGLISHGFMEGPMRINDIEIQKELIRMHETDMKFKNGPVKIHDIDMQVKNGSIDCQETDVQSQNGPIRKPVLLEHSEKLNLTQEEIILNELNLSNASDCSTENIVLSKSTEDST